MSRGWALFAAASALAGCDAPGPTPTPTAVSSSAPPASVTPPRPVVSATAPPGPLEAGGQDARERGALALLEGKIDPLHYPEVATDPGDPFDRGLRARLTTREAKGPILKVLDPKISGKLEEQGVVRAVRQRFGQFRICYDGRLAEQPGLKGKLTAKLVVSPEGSVSSAALTGGDLKDPELKTCVQKALLAVSFSKPESGAAVVEFGLSFEPPPG